MSPPDHPVLIYDGECPLCRRAVEWVRQRDPAGRFEFLPCQAGERAARFPSMTEPTCLESVQLALPDGRVLSGADTLPAIFERLRGWSLVAGALRLPGVRYLSPRVYRWIATNRHQLSAIAVPKKNSAGERCGTDGTCE